jgi:hypothetical protein
MKYKLYFLLFILFLLPKLYAQENIYILFNNEEGDVIKEYSHSKRFYLNPVIDASYFIHHKSNHHIKKVTLESLSDNVISKSEANELVRCKLENKAQKFEKNTGLKGNIHRNPPYNFNALFESIYIYKKTDSLSGTLYEVEWFYAIE